MNVSKLVWVKRQPSGVQTGDGEVDFCYTVFAGTPGDPNWHGRSVSALARQYGGLPAAAAALGYASVTDLQTAIAGICGG
jgi:hypothetical protein